MEFFVPFIRIIAEGKNVNQIKEEETIPPVLNTIGYTVI